MWLLRLNNWGPTVSIFRVAMVLAGTLCISLTLTGGAAAQRSPERVVVTPGEGTIVTRFLFTGAGYQPGRTVDVRVTPPDGSERRFMEDGAVQVWQVQADGTFSLDFIPAVRFPGAGPGRWRALFCTFMAPTCQLIEFDIVG